LEPIGSVWYISHRKSYQKEIRKLAMARYSRESRLHPEEILRRADDFFGAGGLGLKVAERTECCLSFEGGGGHVTVSTALCKPESTAVELETREWDYHAKRFIGEL
jgi:hypothetical protein